MEMNLENMVKWEREKAIYLMGIAEDLGMDLDGYGCLSVNQNSGYTYLWLEDYPFSLAMPINCELQKSDVMVWFTNYENGDEEYIDLNDLTLDDLYEAESEQNEIWGLK